MQNPETDAASVVMSFGTKPKLALWWCAVPMALASVVAIMLVAVLSFGFNGAATILKKVRPLRDAYQFLSGTYDRLLNRLGQKVLRDARDVPALRLMVSVSLTAIPIFLTQLVLGKPQPLLVVAFYISLYGPRFQRFVRLFSAKHLEAHRPHGYFSEKYDKVFGRYIEFFLGYLYGNVPELDRTVHVRLHHKENGGLDDTAESRGYDRTSPLDFLRYLSNNFWTLVGITPYLYFKARGDEKNRRRLLWGMVRYYAYFAAVFIYDWRIGIMFVLVPLLCMNFIMAIAAWIQHAFYDPKHPEDYFAHTVTVLDEVNFMNEGYHLCHHHRAGLHWTEMPEHFEHIRDRMKESGSLVFRDLDFMELFIELTLLRRMDVLAEKLIPWEPMNHEQRLALLASRTRLGTN
jgi:fatty acid desaturase